MPPNELNREIEPILDSRMKPACTIDGLLAADAVSRKQHHAANRVADSQESGHLAGDLLNDVRQASLFPECRNHCIAREPRVGVYELDILGRVEENDAAVIVENQLSPTDHSHLGQLITYAAGDDAAIVIWIATEIRDEHRASIEWLNNHMDVKVSFLLARLDVIRIDNSLQPCAFG
jgi:hypothetical protein